MKIIKKIVNFISNIITIFLLIFITLGLMHVFQITIFRKRYSNVFGYSLFHVLTGSMSPTIEIGDDVFIKITKDIKVGDIVIFDDENVNDFVVHRVINIEGNKITTKGDNNNVIDAEIDHNKIIGKVLLIFPRLGKIQTFFRKPYVIIPLVDGLIIYTIIVDFKKKRKKNYETNDNIEDSKSHKKPKHNKKIYSNKEKNN